MTKIVPVIKTVLGSEKAIGLVEVNQTAPDGTMHRYQLIYVPRDGKSSEFRIDLGLTVNFKGISQLNIPSLMEHTVDELKNIADELRLGKTIDIKDLLQLEKLNLV